MSTQSPAASQSTPSPDMRSFEESYSKLEEVVQTLESGSLTLESTLKAYEEGMQLANRCSQILDEAELKVRQLNTDGSQLLPFEE